ncbi:uncharacterized protein LOC124255899 [Haliotis rubra]|uniref:uncharacterized protein LOC124255899 n=1 Tax=Haliotis rubra TaxID=36100 RepID=UPI001EE5787B|nr:uncharacterized protein LOC124255899 [Haliotis rubra]
MMEAMILLLLVTSAATVAVGGRILCPEIGLLGAPTNLTCIEASRHLSFITPNGHSTAACDTSTGHCIPNGNFSASVINTTSSVLTITALMKSHAGTWKCSNDGDLPDPPSCNMTVAKCPTCTITSWQNDDSNFTVDEEVALKVNVTGDYCSESALFQLQTGNIKTALNYSQWKENTDVIFTLTESHLGEVKLVFICGGYSKALSCEGIQELKERIVPSSTDRAGTSTLAPVTETLVFIAPVCIVSVLLVLVIVIFLYKRRHRHRTSKMVNALHSLVSRDAEFSTICVVEGAVSWANITNRSLPPTPGVQDTVTDPGYAAVAEGAVSMAETPTTDTACAEGSNPIANPDDMLMHVKSALSAPDGDSGDSIGMCDIDRRSTSPPLFEPGIEGKNTFDNPDSKMLHSESLSQSILFEDPGYSSVIVTRSRSISARGSCTKGTSPDVIPEDTLVNDCNGAAPDVSELYAKVVKTKDITEPEVSGVSVVVLK